MLSSDGNLTQRQVVGGAWSSVRIEGVAFAAAHGTVACPMTSSPPEPVYFARVDPLSSSLTVSTQIPKMTSASETAPRSMVSSHVGVVDLGFEDVRWTGACPNCTWTKGSMLLPILVRSCEAATRATHGKRACLE